MSITAPRRALSCLAGLALVASALLVGTTGSATADPGTGGGNQPQIVGGSAAPAARYPYFAQLQIQTSQGTAGCGGALVTPVVVLTAAHCVVDFQGALVGFGQDQTGVGGQVVQAAGAAAAPDYNAQAFDNDYGFVVLQQPVTAYPTIKLAGPSETALWRPGARVGAAMGYGLVSEGGSPSPTLQDVALPIQADSYCGAASAYGTTYRPISMLCVGYPEGGRSTCQGDSGGPLVVPGDGGVVRIAGLVSFAQGCARPGFPTVFTRAAEPSFAARMQQFLNDIKAANPSLFPGAYSDTNILGSGAVPVGCTAARNAAATAAATTTATAKAVKKAKKRVKKATAQLKAAKKLHGAKGAKAVKSAKAVLKIMAKKLKKAKKKDKAAAQASAAAGAAGTAACS